MFAYYERKRVESKREREEDKKMAEEEHQREVAKRARKMFGLPDLPDDNEFEARKKELQIKKIKKRRISEEDVRKRKITWRRVKILFKCFFKL